MDERTFVVGRTFTTSNGDPDRQITDMQIAGAADHPYRPGVMLVWWASSADRYGSCTERSFRTWIRKTGARPLPMKGK